MRHFIYTNIFNFRDENSETKKRDILMSFTFEELKVIIHLDKQENISRK